MLFCFLQFAQDVINVTEPPVGLNALANSVPPDPARLC